MNTRELALLDATAQAALCLRRELSEEELLDACITRIDTLNPMLLAIVEVQRARPQASKGPLQGVPFIVKDATAWPGLRWSMGSRLFRRNVAHAHTAFTRSLSDAGLVCVGKSATSELGLLASTESALEGVTHNPWGLSFSPMGSSGGSAVAVAAGLVPIAHANDGGGSIRMPASACGVFGFKPSRARTMPASTGHSDFAAMTSDHCITRSVRDSALWLSITEDKTRPTVGFVKHPISRRLRIAAWCQDIFGEAPDARVLRAYQDSIRKLLALGHHIDEVHPPAFAVAALRDAFFAISGAAVAEIVDAIDASRSTPVQERELEPFTWSLHHAYIERGARALPDARRALEDAVRTYDACTHGYDAVLTPVLAQACIPLGHLSPFVEPAVLRERIARVVAYTPLQNIAGCPAMSVPHAFEEGETPIGMHLAAPRGADATLLELAYEWEAAYPWRDRWPPLSIPRLLQHD